MNRFCGKVGYILTQPAVPGVWEEKVVVERTYYGDVLNMGRRWDTTSYQNDNLRITNKFSILADAFAYQNFHAIRYVDCMGTKWKVISAEVEEKRILLTVGEEWNGEEPDEDET